MKSDSARQFCLWLRRIPVDEIGDRIDCSHSRCKRVARWLMGASLVLLLGYSQTLVCQTTSSKAKDDTADDDFILPMLLRWMAAATYTLTTATTTGC